MHISFEILLIAAAILTVTAGPGWAIGPSFDCGKVTTPLTRFICASPKLSQIDLEFTQAYFALRQQVGPTGWQPLKEEAIDFQNQIAKRCGIAPSGTLPADAVALAACVEQGYDKQRAEWLSRLNGPAREEASRPIEQHVALQRDLQRLGFLPPVEQIDGVYGAATRSAVLAWQRSLNLPPTGLLGEADAETLARDAGAAAESGPVSGGVATQDRVAADKRAKRLAYDADKGDNEALDKLRTEAAAGIPSALYGLSQFYSYQRAAKYGPTTYTALLDAYFAKDPSFRAAQEEAERFKAGHDDGNDTAMRQIIALQQSAAQLGDPAAQGKLGAEYLNEVLRWAMILEFIWPGRADDFSWMHMDPQGIVILRAFKWACSQAKSLLSQSMRQNWPDAFLAFGMMYANASPPSLLAEPGCWMSNLAYADQLMHRAAELGSPDAQWALRNKYESENRAPDAVVWDNSLRELANEGDKEARDLIDLHSPNER